MCAIETHLKFNMHKNLLEVLLNCQFCFSMSMEGLKFSILLLTSFKGMSILLAQEQHTEW